MKDTREFHLQLFNPVIGANLSLVPIIGVLMLFGIAFGGLVLLPIKDPWMAGVYLAAVLGGGGFWGFCAYKKWALISAKVLVDNVGLMISNNDYELFNVLYKNIKSYRYQSFNESEELRITLLNNERLKIRANSRLTKVGDFAGMVLAFETQLNQLNGLGETLAIKREKAFFEKPISTVLLVIFTVLLLFVFWEMSHSHKPVRGNLIVSIGSYFTYLAGWLAAAERRRQA